ncbi:hypothetical protein GCM10009601_25980 [Streptomyces thermospinosisporus]|uniref:Cellulase n=1 Tax=Streptomyces thermospinosisporus TaxID=161482 RepID=A0ABP4JM15_9ACTN
MDDFERELARMMRGSHRPSPYGPDQQQRLYAGIRSRRRARMLWRAGGSALAVTGIGIGLALLPALNDGSRPEDRQPLPATTPSAPPVLPSPTASVPPADPSTSPPPDSSGAGTSLPGGGRTPTSLPPSPTEGAGTTPPPPDGASQPVSRSAWHSGGPPGPESADSG